MKAYRENGVLLKEWDLVEFLLHPKDAKQFPPSDLVIFTIDIGCHQAEKMRTFWKISNVANTPRKPIHRAVGLLKVQYIVASPTMPDISVSEAKKNYDFLKRGWEGG